MYPPFGLCMDEPLGILLYGYGETDAGKIRDTLARLVGRDVILLSAGGRDDIVVSDILNMGPVENTFVDSDVKVCMFLGFAEDTLQPAMRGFPADVARPIFCGLTENNYNWTVKQLVEHLQEEKAYWEGGGPGNRSFRRSPPAQSGDRPG